MALREAMVLHIIFVADYGEVIEVSDRLPEPRLMPGYESYSIPVHQWYKLTRLRVEAETLPALPIDDLTQDEYRGWRSLLDDFTEEAVDQHLVAVGLAGICVDVNLAAVDAGPPLGTLLEATVKNVGPYPAGKIQVVWFTDWNTPRKIVESGIVEAGRGPHFLPVGHDSRELPPGASLTFALPKDKLRECLGSPKTLGLDQIRIVVNATKPDGGAFYEVAHVRGSLLGQLLKDLRQFLETEEPQ